MNYFKKLKLFRAYKKNLKKNKEYLFNKYGLEYNLWYDLYSTMTFVDAPEELKLKLDFSFKELELKKYISSVKSDLEKLELNELVTLKEIIKIDSDNYGIGFGFALVSSNKTFMLTNLMVSAGSVILLGLSLLFIL